MVPAALTVAGCASFPERSPKAASNVAHTSAVSLPLLRLPPESLGRYMAEYQALTIEGPGGTTATMDVLLEIDGQGLRMALLQMGRVMARMQWDGSQLHTMRAPGWPQEVSEERILSDMQMALWPLPTVQASLPPTWSMVQLGAIRYLREHNEDRVVFASEEPGHTIIDYLHSGWRLTIRSRAGSPAHSPDSTLGTGGAR